VSSRKTLQSGKFAPASLARRRRRVEERRLTDSIKDLCLAIGLIRKRPGYRGTSREEGRLATLPGRRANIGYEGEFATEYRKFALWRISATRLTGLTRKR